MPHKTVLQADEAILEVLRSEEAKGGKAALIPLVPEARPIAVKWMQGAPPSDRLFRHASADKMSKAFTEARKRALPEKPRLTMHRLRAGCAVYWLRRGARLPYVQRLLRHSQIQTTMRYLRLVDTDLQDEIERVSLLSEYSDARTSDVPALYQPAGFHAAFAQPSHMGCGGQRATAPAPHEARASLISCADAGPMPSISSSCPFIRRTLCQTEKTALQNCNKRLFSVKTWLTESGSEHTPDRSDLPHIHVRLLHNLDR